MKIVSEGKKILMVLKIEDADICASWMTAHNRLYEFRVGSVTLQLFDPLDWKYKKNHKLGLSV